MITRYSVPPLRLILNNNCNGKCSFCHNEGYHSHENMSLKLIHDCIDSAEKLSISQIALTGGEPTLRDDLKDIIDYIQDKQMLSISLTTNGYKLNNLIKFINRPIDNLNLSMSSLKMELAEKYQNVNPYMALDSLYSFPAKTKSINIVITKENYTEFSDFIRICSQKKILLNVMFENRQDEEYIDIQKKFLNQLLQNNEGNIILRSTPVLTINFNNECNIRIKHPYLSKLLHNGICEGCSKYDKCFEKVCAIRVRPDGIVTPCLLKEIYFDEDSMYTRIQNAYNSLQTMVFDKHFYKLI